MSDKNAVYRDEDGEIWISTGAGEVILVDKSMIRRIAEKIGSVPEEETIGAYGLKELT